MKWIGQHIYDLVSRFRSDVYLEDIDTGTIASGGNLGLDSNNKIVKATETTGDITGVDLTGAAPISINSETGTTGGDYSATIGIASASTTVIGAVELATTAETTTGTDTTRAVTPDGLKDGYQGSANVTTVGTIGTGEWRGTAINGVYIADDTINSQHYADESIDTAHIADAQITVAKLHADAIQTSSESFADNDTSIMTSAAIDDKINTKYAYQYVMFYAQDIIKSNWITFSNSGLTNHVWGTDTSDNGVTVGSSTIACDKNLQAAGFKIPFACKFVGFYGTGHRFNGDNSFSAGVFILDSPDYQGAADGGTGINTVNATLRAYADAEQNASDGFNQKLNKVVDTSRSFDCPVGSMIFPAFKDTAGVDSGSFRGNMTIILATPIVTI
jgi:hypothetical protein